MVWVTRIMVVAAAELLDDWVRRADCVVVDSESSETAVDEGSRDGSALVVAGA